MVVLKELCIFKIVFTLGGCGGLERTDIFNSFYFGRVWLS